MEARNRVAGSKPMPKRQRHGADRRYRFVDFAAQRLPGFRNHVVPADQVEELFARYGPEECYASIFFFSDEVVLYMAEHRVNGQPSIAGFDGRVWASFLPFDIDATPDVHGLADALALTRATYRFLTERWEAPASALYVYFSGAKGFHLLLDSHLFGRVAPARDLHRVFSHLRLQVWRALERTAQGARFDLAIGDKVRLLRLPNSQHRESGLYKVLLTEAELFELPPPGILERARTPRDLGRTLCHGLLPGSPVAASPAARRAFLQAQRAVRRGRLHPYRFPAPPADVSASLCPARQRMLAEDVAPGFRNNVAIRLASALRRAGYTEGHTQTILQQWNAKLAHPLPERELRAVVRSAFARPFPYAYGCHDEVIRHFCPFRDNLWQCEIYRRQHPHLVSAD